jgi:hypothetical protein
MLKRAERSVPRWAVREGVLLRGADLDDTTIFDLLTMVISFLFKE